MGNWKLNPVTLAEAKALTHILNDKIQDINDLLEVVIAPSFLHLSSVNDIKNTHIKLMAQDVSIQDKESGAFTGDVSAAQLASMGVDYILVGHSERRQYQQENDQILIDKITAATNQGLQVVLCVGEDAQQRQQQQHQQTISQQLHNVLTQLPEIKQLTVAYEPVWAIGTGLTAEVADIQAMHLHIRQQITAIYPSYQHTSLLYGGSVKPENVAGIAACADVDGVLVGGASLKPEQFLDIVTSFR